MAIEMMLIMIHCNKFGAGGDPGPDRTGPDRAWQLRPGRGPPFRPGPRRVAQNDSVSRQGIGAPSRYPIKVPA